MTAPERDADPLYIPFDIVAFIETRMMLGGREALIVACFQDGKPFLGLIDEAPSDCLTVPAGAWAHIVGYGLFPRTPSPITFVVNHTLECVQVDAPASLADLPPPDLGFRLDADDEPDGGAG